MPDTTRFIRILSPFVCCLVLFACSQSENKSNAEPDTTEDSPSTDSLTIHLTGADSVTVFDLLQQSHDVDYQSSAMGVFVKAIDSVYSSENYFWVYSVNDSMAKTAADNYLTSDGDKVVWHFRKVGP